MLSGNTDYLTKFAEEEGLLSKIIASFRNLVGKPKPAKTSPTTPSLLTPTAALPQGALQKGRDTREGFRQLTKQLSTKRIETPEDMAKAQRWKHLQGKLNR